MAIKDIFFKLLDPLNLFKLNEKPAAAPAAPTPTNPDAAEEVRQKTARDIAAAGTSTGGQTVFTSQSGTAESALQKILGG